MREERVLKQRFWRFLAANIVMVSGLNQRVTRNIPALISHEIVPRKTLGRILGSTGKPIVIIYVYAHIQWISYDEHVKPGIDIGERDGRGGTLWCSHCNCKILFSWPEGFTLLPSNLPNLDSPRPISDPIWSFGLNLKFGYFCHSFTVFLNLWKEKKWNIFKEKLI